MEKVLPKISILMPTYNRCHFLKEAIESAMMQDYDNLEIIISDNNSTDDTKEIIWEFLKDKRVRYYKNTTNVGMVLNWRKLLYEYCTGEWMLILSDDDILIDKSYLSKASEIIRNNSDVKMVYANGYIEDINKNTKVKLELPYEGIEDGKKIFLNAFLEKEFVKPQEFTLCNILFNVSLAKQEKAFSNIDNICCDSELFLKSCLMGKVAIIKECVSIYRFHSNNLIRMQIDYKEILGRFDVPYESYKLALRLHNINEEIYFQLKQKILKHIDYGIINGIHNSKNKQREVISFFYKRVGMKMFFMSVLNPRFIWELV